MSRYNLFKCASASSVPPCLQPPPGGSAGCEHWPLLLPPAGAVLSCWERRTCAPACKDPCHFSPRFYAIVIVWFFWKELKAEFEAAVSAVSLFYQCPWTCSCSHVEINGPVGHALSLISRNTHRSVGLNVVFTDVIQVWTEEWSCCERTAVVLNLWSRGHKHRPVCTSEQVLPSLRASFAVVLW